MSEWAKSFVTKCTVLKKVLVALLELFGAFAVNPRHHNNSAPGELCPLAPPPPVMSLNTSPQHAGGKCVRIRAGRSVVRLSAESYQDIVSDIIVFLAGARGMEALLMLSRTQKNESSDANPCKNSVTALQDRHNYKVQ